MSRWTATSWYNWQTEHWREQKWSKLSVTNNVNLCQRKWSNKEAGHLPPGPPRRAFNFSSFSESVWRWNLFPSVAMQLSQTVWWTSLLKCFRHFRHRRAWARLDTRTLASFFRLQPNKPFPSCVSSLISVWECNLFLFLLSWKGGRARHTRGPGALTWFLLSVFVSFQISLDL